MEEGSEIQHQEFMFLACNFLFNYKFKFFNRNFNYSNKFLLNFNNYLEIFNKIILKRNNKELKKIIKNEKKYYFDKFHNWIQDKTNSFKNFWKYLKYYQNKNLINNFNLNFQNIIEFWEKIYSNNKIDYYLQNLINLDLILEKNENLKEKKIFLDEIEEIIENNLYLILKELPKDKSPGLDLIPYEVLKNLINNFNNFNNFKRLIYLIIKNNDISEKMKKIKLIFIPKNKNITSPGQLRPISLQNTILKLIEKIILIFLQNEIEKKKLFNEFQFGFRKKFSTQNNLFILKTLINFHKFNRFPSFLLFVDIQKAFDSVDHTILIKKLILNNFNNYLIILIKKLITEKKIKIYYNNQKKEIKSTNGLPQGSILSLILFNFYLFDLEEKLNLKKGEKIIFYADDICIITYSRKRIKKIILNLKEWLILNKLIINKEKSKIIILNKRFEKKEKKNEIENEIEEIKIGKEVEYLGINIKNEKSLYLKNNNLKKNNKILKKITYLLFLQKSNPKNIKFIFKSKN